MPASRLCARPKILRHRVSRARRSCDGCAPPQYFPRPKYFSPRAARPLRVRRRRSDRPNALLPNNHGRPPIPPRPPSAAHPFHLFRQPPSKNAWPFCGLARAIQNARRPKSGPARPQKYRRNDCLRRRSRVVRPRSISNHRSVLIATPDRRTTRARRAFYFFDRSRTRCRGRRRP